MNNKIYVILLLISYFFPMNYTYAYFDPIKCGLFIQGKQKVENFDVRKEAMECSWKVLKKGGGERLFKICFVKKMKLRLKNTDKIKTISDKTWTILKKACT